MTSQHNIIIPDLLATWPWKRVLNPMLDEVKNETNAWVKSQTLFEPAQMERFFDCDFNRLAALIAPLHDKEHLGITCDLMNFLFAYDEYTDLTNKPEATKIADGVMDVFRRKNDSIHSSNDKMAVMAQELFQRIVSVVGEDVPGMESFISNLDAYTKAIIQEAEDRVAGHQRTVHDYMILRRDTIGARPTHSFLGLGLDIPNAVFEHPLMVSLIDDATDILAITNDMHSYTLECSRGLDGHNIITVAMQEYHLDLQQALYWLYGYTSKIISNFLSNQRALPSWGEEIDQLVGVYIDRVARFVRGNDAWCYETKRYYGGNGLNVQEYRKTTLLPPDSGYITREQLGLEILVA